MQIVIDIPEEEYRCVQITGCIGNNTCISNAIYNGILLPKGHGRLIDADALIEKAPEIQEYLDVIAPTIIEAGRMIQITDTDTGYDDWCDCYDAQEGEI